LFLVFNHRRRVVTSTSTSLSAKIHKLFLTLPACLLLLLLIAERFIKMVNKAALTNNNAAAANESIHKRFAFQFH